MIKKIQKHLKDANKGYFEHQRFAFKASLNCLISAFTALVHGICPAFFEYNTSTNIKKMHNDMQPIYKMREDKNNN